MASQSFALSRLGCFVAHSLIYRVASALDDACLTVSESISAPMCLVGPPGSGVSSFVALWAARMYNTHCVGKHARVKDRPDLPDEVVSSVDLNDLESLMESAEVDSEGEKPPSPVRVFPQEDRSAPLPFISVARTNQPIKFDNHEVGFIR